LGRLLLTLLAGLCACAGEPQPVPSPGGEPASTVLRRQLQKGDFTAVIDGFSEADSPSPADYEYRFLARAHLALGRYQDALSALDRALLHRPEDPELYDLKGAVHTADSFSRSQFASTDAAMAAFTRAVKLDSTRAHTLFNLGLLHQYREQEGLADSFYQRAIAFDSTLAMAHKKLGLLRRDQGDLQEARSYLTRASRHAPDDAESLFYLGLVQRTLGEFEDARRTLERAAELNPLSPQVHLNLAGVYTRLGRRDEGTQAIRRSELLRKFDRGIGTEKSALSHRSAVNVAPTTARYNTALHLALRGEREAAEREFRHLLEVLPDHEDALSALGLLLLWRGEAEEASRYLRRAVAVDPLDAVNLTRLGMGLRRSGRRAAAADTLHRALQLDPFLPEPILELAMINAQFGRFAAAESLFSRAIRLAPDNAEAHINLGVSRMRQGDLEAAAEAYRRAVELDPQGARARRYLREALQQQVQGPGGPSPSTPGEVPTP
jgi:Flp pilus assembly protein TadD